MMTKGFFVLTASLMLAASPVYAGDARAGKTKAENRVQCHGATGKDDPGIAGMEEAKFIKAMKD